jgi:hypothetical protein
MKIHVLLDVTPSWLVNSYLLFIGKKPTVHSWTVRPWKCTRHARSKYQALFTNRHGWTSQKTWTFGCQVLRLGRKVYEYSYWQWRVPEEVQLNSPNACYHSVQNLYFSCFLFKPLRNKTHRKQFFLWFCRCAKPSPAANRTWRILIRLISGVPLWI